METWWEGDADKISHGVNKATCFSQMTHGSDLERKGDSFWRLSRALSGWGYLDLPLPLQHQLSHPENNCSSLTHSSGGQLKKAFYSCQENSAKI